LSYSKQINQNMKKYTGKIIVYLLVAAFAFACAKVPITGRRQLKLLPESELEAMSLTNYNQFLSENKVVTTGVDAASLKRVGDKISKAVTTYLTANKYADRVDGYQWEFKLVQDNTVNAWCMPGGKVVFYSGIIPFCQNETGIAVVMGHEIAHAIARHGNERMSQGVAQQLGGVALAVAVADKPQETQQLFGLAYGLGTQVGVMLPFSRKHESEADEMGLYFMAMAGYNPKEAPAFWERMNAAGGARPPEFISTHPSPETRVANLNTWMPKAEKYYTATLAKP
jgi:predicted Zn-dependent protease